MFTFPMTMMSSSGFENTLSTSFNGVDEWVNGDTNSITNDLSVFAWIQVPNNTQTRTVAANFHSGIGQRAWTLGNIAGGQMRVRLSENGTSNAKSLTCSDFNIEKNGWHLVGFTFNTANQLTIYVDGVKGINYTGTNNPMTSLHNSTTDFSIGSLRNGSEKFIGDIDEVTVWKDTVLSDSEIVALYNAGQPTDPTTLTTSATLSNWYRMGDGDDATTIYDNVGRVDCTLIAMDATNYTTDVPT